MIGKLTSFINKDDDEPLILVAQLFKPNQYLNQINVQNSLYASRVFLNPDFPNVVAFKNRLLIEGDIGSQRINHIETQPQYSVIDELSRVTDGTGCINIMLWNQEAKIILEKSANDIRVLMGVEQDLSNVVPTTKNNDLDSDGNEAAIDSGTESIFESGLDTSDKYVMADSALSLGVSELTNLKV
ncbi:hypothetical protein Ahy_A09g044898 [Arachis hypogaea]|uniref:Uncharacterized protein n=1 Tax=Arachis hypogaea TaxID=3818 RepID=A0A445BL20_ARAHY|nr:hypothetical protein Ahy_A09g044898 [Arachis hypogaea]